jgi:hypothetical protein
MGTPSGASTGTRHPYRSVEPDSNKPVLDSTIGIAICHGLFEALYGFRTHELEIPP